MKKTKSVGLVESFYRGEGKMLYFVKPVQFANPDKQELHIDFTYDHDNDTTNPVVCNYSIFSETPYKIKGVHLMVDDQVFESDSMKLFFVEQNPKKKGWHNRNSFQVSYADFNSFIKSDDPKIRIGSENGEETYTVKKAGKWTKYQIAVEEGIFLPTEVMKDN